LNKDLIKIIKPQTPKEFEVYYLLRYNILRKSWNQPLGSEKDEQENSSIHLMAVNESNDAMGVCRLQFNSSQIAQIRYMGVDTNYQNLGIGKKLIIAAEDIAKENKIATIILHARENAIPFYLSCNYKIVEKSYLMWNTIQHYLMSKEI